MINFQTCDLDNVSNRSEGEKNNIHDLVLGP